MTDPSNTPIEELVEDLSEKDQEEILMLLEETERAERAGSNEEED